MPGRISPAVGSSVEQLGAHGDKAVEEIGVQGLEGGIVGLQRLGEAVLGDQEVGEEVNPPGQGGVRCAAVRQQGRTGLTELDKSLRRLGAGHVDLYQIHRWDPGTSDEETLSALTDLQRAGKIRYFGSSTFPAYRIVQAEWAARENHLSRYVTEQPSYSILQRGIETHVLPVTEQYGLGVLVWSPLASGWLSGAIREGREITTSRSAFMPQRFDTALPSNRARLDAVEQLDTVAGKAGLTMIQLALGFVTAHPAVTSAIIAPGTDLAAHEKYDTPPALLDAAQRRRRSLSADARPRCCAGSPSTPTCGTSPAATSTTPPAAAHCLTATAPRSVATPPRSPARSTCQSPTTSPASPGT